MVWFKSWLVYLLNQDLMATRKPLPSCVSFQNICSLVTPSMMFPNFTHIHEIQIRRRLLTSTPTFLGCFYKTTTVFRKQQDTCYLGESDYSTSRQRAFFSFISINFNFQQVYLPQSVSLVTRSLCHVSKIKIMEFEWFLTGCFTRLH